LILKTSIFSSLSFCIKLANVQFFAACFIINTIKIKEIQTKRSERTRFVYKKQPFTTPLLLRKKGSRTSIRLFLTKENQVISGTQS